MREKKKIYVETSVVSYLTARPSHDSIKNAQQLATQDWWNSANERFELFSSGLVMKEASKGDVEAAKKRIAAVEATKLLPITEEMIGLAEMLLEKTAVPKKSLDDAIHIATAAINKMDYIVSWNCKHIANPETKPLIRKVCESMGYVYPEICTPFDLLGVE